MEHTATVTNHPIRLAKRRFEHTWRVLIVCFAAAVSAMAQTTTNFTATVTLREQDGSNYTRTLLGNGAVGTLGNALLTLSRVQNINEQDFNSGVGPVGGGLNIAFNRADSIFVASSATPDLMAATATIPGRVMNGTGAYAGAAGPAAGMMLTLARTSTNPLTYSLSLAGSATVGSQTLNLAITNVPVVQVTAVANVFGNEMGTAVFTPFGNATVTGQGRPDTNRWDDSVSFVEVILSFTFSPTDSLQIFFKFDVKTEQPGPITIIGGTGAYAGASGTAMVTDLREGPGGEDIVAISGSLTRAGPTTPIITSVNTASGGNPFAQNTWIEIKGTNLAPRTTPAGGMFWSNAPEFAQGRMPTELGGVSVTVNGKPAHAWWFCSAATTPSCASDQINVLTPLDDYMGRVLIVVKNGSEPSGAILRLKNPATPAFLLFHPKGNAVATHADGSLLAPATLFPGVSTPARRGETVSLWGVGFGLPTTALTAGSSTQRGSLPKAPACWLGGSPAQVAAALVSPGLYQFNVTVQDNAAAGEHHFYCTYDGVLTPSLLVAVQ